MLLRPCRQWRALGSYRTRQFGKEKKTTLHENSLLYEGWSSEEAREIHEKKKASGSTVHLGWQRFTYLEQAVAKTNVRTHVYGTRGARTQGNPARMGPAVVAGANKKKRIGALMLAGSS